MPIRWIWGFLAAAAFAAGPATVSESRRAVVLELFTSEGCSSCPPADALLEKLDREQPVPGAEIIVLSEHVDYWNQLGWKDPYSSSFFSERQQNYAKNLRLQEPYTPQLVIDGSIECLGSDPAKATAAVRQALAEPAVPVRISASGTSGAVEIVVPPLPAGKLHKANIYLAHAADSGVSDVLRGENRGRKLHHVSVVSDMKEIGAVKGNAGFNTQIPISDLPPGSKLVVFVQEPGTGRIWGAAALRIPQ